MSTATSATATGTGSQAAAATTAAVCGNGVREADEQCDGMDLGQMTCATLGMGSATAVLRCNARCMFDTFMCFNGTQGAPAGGTGAGGTGAMTSGSAGSGGTGS